MLIRLSLTSCSQLSLFFARFWTPCLPIPLKSNIYWRCSTQAALGCVSAFCLDAFFGSPRLSQASAMQADVLHTSGSDVEQTWGGENLNISYKESGKIPAWCSEKICAAMARAALVLRTAGGIKPRGGSCGRNEPCGEAESVQGSTGVSGRVQEQKPQQPRAELSPAQQKPIAMLPNHSKKKKKEAFTLAEFCPRTMFSLSKPPCSLGAGWEHLWGGLGACFHRGDLEVVSAFWVQARTTEACACF